MVSHDVAEGLLKRALPIGMKYGSCKLVYRRESLRRKEFRILRDWLLDETRELRQQPQIETQNRDDEAARQQSSMSTSPPALPIPISRRRTLCG